MKKSILLISAVSFVLASKLIAGPASDITIKYATGRAIELEAYLAQNPNAADKLEAVKHLLSAYELTGNDKRFAELLQIKFDAIKGGADLDPQELFSTTKQLFHILLDAGNEKAAKKVIASANNKAKGHEAGTQLQQSFARWVGEINKTSIGDVIEVKFKSVGGKDVDLAAMKGKVVLIDFWATWCGPCIEKLPNIQDTYNKFHDKGFEVIGISLDFDKDKLTKFVADRKIPWVQFCDGQGWGNHISASFGITAVPTTYLIGTDGKVIGINLDDDELAAAIKEQLATDR